MSLMEFLATYLPPAKPVAPQSFKAYHKPWTPTPDDKEPPF